MEIMVIVGSDPSGECSHQLAWAGSFLQPSAQTGEGSVLNVEMATFIPVCPENLKLFIDLTFCEFLLMLDQ
jgi:hypothetical protein